MLYCKKCESQVQKGDTLCRNCGAIFKVSNKQHFFLKIIVALVLIVMIVYIAFMVDYFVVAKNRASYKSKQRAVIGTLRSFGSAEEDYKSVFAKYGTIEDVARSNRNDLRLEKYGYVFKDLMERPDANFYAILASPKNWDKYRDCHYIITNTGIVRKWPEEKLPFERSLSADKNSVEKIEALQDAIKYFLTDK